MAGYLARRVALAIPVLLGISLIVFLMLHSAGGDPAAIKLGEHANPDSIARAHHAMGLDRPLAIQYLDFLRHAVTGDLGRSYRSNASVSSEVMARFPATIELAIVSILIGAAIGLAAGAIAAVRRHTWFDYASTFGALIGVSIPTFWMGIILIIVFSIHLHWLPISGRVDSHMGVNPSDHFVIANALFHGNWIVFKDALRHILLPALTLAGWPAAIIARMTRASLMEAMDQDYVRTARAKGLQERVVIGRHAFRNALIPILTVIGLELGGLLGGAVVTETVFAWPGVGKLTADAIIARDYQVTQGVVLLLGAVFVGLNLLVDLAYAALDPRIRYGA